MSYFAQLILLKMMLTLFTDGTQNKSGITAILGDSFA